MVKKKKWFSLVKIFVKKDIIVKNNDGTSLDYMRGSLAKENLLMSKARATLNSKSAPEKGTRRHAEVGAFDTGRPPPLLEVSDWKSNFL